MSTPSPSPRSRRLRILFVCLAVFAVVLLGGYFWLLNAAQSALTQRLAAKGVGLKYSSKSWSPWRGLTLTNASLRRLSAANEPLLELDHLHVDVLWREAWQARTAITRWQSNDATLTLHDDKGAVTLRHFTTDFVLRDGKCDVSHLNTSDGNLTFGLTAQILTGDDSSPNLPVVFDLEPVRAVLHAVHIKAGTGPLAITGPFMLDLREKAATWNATLHAAGKNVEWRGVPMQDTVIDAQLSQAEMKLAANLKFAQGSAKIDLARQGWEQTPLMLSGTLTDSAGHVDEFNGDYQDTTSLLTIAELNGAANVLELLSNVPSIGADLPAQVKIRTFPDIAAEKFVWHSDDHSSDWTLASLQLRSPAEVAVTIRDHPLVIDQVKGRLSYDQRTWQFDGVKGQLLGGSFSLDGSYDGKTLSKADVSLHEMKLASLSPWLNVSASLDNSDLSLTYHGSVCRQPVHSTGRGTLQLTNAPEVHVPLLDQAYELFPTLIPHEHRGGTGDLQVSFAMTKGVATIDPLKARGESVTVTGTGTINLVERQVSGRARANLRGVVGVATSPFSHLLTEMQVSGPLDDVRVAPLSAGAAAKNLVTGTIGAASGTVTGSARLSSGLLQNSLSLPFEALGIFGKSDGKAAE